MQERVALSLHGPCVALLNQAYGFDRASRMTNVSDGTYQAGYSYLANSPLISQIVYRSNSTTRMTTTKSYDFLNRLGSISSQPSATGAVAIAYHYAYNDANQRTRVNVDDGSFWIYEYDSLGQLVSGKRYWSDWTPVAGQQYEYAFDDIGNRTSAKAGGDAGGAELRSASYTANALNQYTSRDVPGYVNVFGIAHPSASVAVNSASAYRRGEYFWKELGVDNTSAAQWQAVTNIGSLTGTNQTNTGNLFLPKTAESFTYDLDGNQTSDGRWTNRWDGENRLIEMTSHASGPSGSRMSLQFGYDSGSRRYSKVVSNWTGSAWTKALHEKFLYDGWNLLAAIDGTNAVVIRSFLWGLDLSGSLQGAGGVGGLIAFRQHSGSQAGTHFAAFDGNGNVMGLVDSGGNLSARYEYDPFGQTVRASGSVAAINPVRFSSKVIDEETDLAYYGYRYLNPNTGRWPSRDPIGIRGGLNLYGGVRNDFVDNIDKLGLLGYRVETVNQWPHWTNEFKSFCCRGRLRVGLRTGSVQGGTGIAYPGAVGSWACWFSSAYHTDAGQLDLSCNADGKIVGNYPYGNSAVSKGDDISIAWGITASAIDGSSSFATVSIGAGAAYKGTLSVSLAGGVVTITGSGNKALLIRTTSATFRCVSDP